MMLLSRVVVCLVAQMGSAACAPLSRGDSAPLSLVFNTRLGAPATFNLFHPVIQTTGLLFTDTEAVEAVDAGVDAAVADDTELSDTGRVVEKSTDSTVPIIHLPEQDNGKVLSGQYLEMFPQNLLDSVKPIDITIIEHEDFIDYEIEFVELDDKEKEEKKENFREVKNLQQVEAGTEKLPATQAGFEGTSSSLSTATFMDLLNRARVRYRSRARSEDTSRPLVKLRGRRPTTTTSTSTTQASIQNRQRNRINFRISPRQEIQDENILQNLKTSERLSDSDKSNLDIQISTPSYDQADKKSRTTLPSMSLSSISPSVVEPTAKPVTLSVTTERPSSTTTVPPTTSPVALSTLIPTSSLDEAMKVQLNTMVIPTTDATKATSDHPEESFGLQTPEMEGLKEIPRAAEDFVDSTIASITAATWEPMRSTMPATSPEGQATEALDQKMISNMYSLNPLEYVSEISDAASTPFSETVSESLTEASVSLMEASVSLMEASVTESSLVVRTPRDVIRQFGDSVSEADTTETAVDDSTDNETVVEDSTDVYDSTPMPEAGGWGMKIVVPVPEAITFSPERQPRIIVNQKDKNQIADEYNDHQESTTVDLYSGEYLEVNPGQYHEVNPGQYTEVNPGQYHEINPGQYVEINPGQYTEDPLGGRYSEGQHEELKVDDVTVDFASRDETKIYNLQAKAGDFILGEVGKINLNNGQTLQGVRYTAVDGFLDQGQISDILQKFFGTETT